MYLTAYIYDTNTREEKLIDILVSKEFKEVLGKRKIKLISFGKDFLDNAEYDKFLSVIHGKSTRAPKLIAYLDTEDDRKFSVELLTRVDCTAHNKSRVHINIDLEIRDLQINKNKKKIQIGKLHMIIVENKKGLFDHWIVHVGLNSNGASIGYPFVFLPDKKDRYYILSQDEFFEKIKSKKITPADEIKFRKKFNEYSKFVRDRRKKFWSGM